MEFIKKYGLLSLIFLGAFFIGSFLLSILNYFLLASKTTHIIGLFYLLIVCIVLSFLTSKKSNSRGIITGLKNGFLFIGILLLINLVFFQSPFKFMRLFYYIILVFASIFGAIFGVNTKKE